MPWPKHLGATALPPTVVVQRIVGLWDVAVLQGAAGAPLTSTTGRRILSTETRNINTDSKSSPGRWEIRPNAKKKPSTKQTKPTESQGPCPGLMGFCISALTVPNSTPHRLARTSPANAQPFKKHRPKTPLHQLLSSCRSPTRHDLFFKNCILAHALPHELKDELLALRMPLYSLHELAELPRREGAALASNVPVTTSETAQTRCSARA